MNFTDLQKLMVLLDHLQILKNGGHFLLLAELYYVAMIVTQMLKKLVILSGFTAGRVSRKVLL